MTRLRQASGIATLFLLAWTPTAHAECAWVLWRLEMATLANGAPKSMAVVIDDIAETQERCKSLMSASVARSAAEPDAALVLRDGVAYKHKNGEEQARSYLCIPDTKDPRVLLKDLQPGRVGPNAEP